MKRVIDIHEIRALLPKSKINTAKVELLKQKELPFVKISTDLTDGEFGEFSSKIEDLFGEDLYEIYVVEFYCKFQIWYKNDKILVCSTTQTERYENIAKMLLFGLDENTENPIKDN